MCIRYKLRILIETFLLFWYGYLVRKKFCLISALTAFHTFDIHSFPCRPKYFLISLGASSLTYMLFRNVFNILFEYCRGIFLLLISIWIWLWSEWHTLIDLFVFNLLRFFYNLLYDRPWWMVYVPLKEYVFTGCWSDVLICTIIKSQSQLYFILHFISTFPINCRERSAKTFYNFRFVYNSSCLY